MKSLIITLFAIILSFSIEAQTKCPKAEQIERIKAQKAAFITERIGLTSAVAQRFWPVYNEYWQKKDSLITRRSNARIELKENMEKLTAAQKEASLDLQMQLRWEEARLDRNYHHKFKQILTIDQVILLYEAEHEFRIRLIRVIRESNASIESQEVKNQYISKI